MAVQLPGLGLMPEEYSASVLQEELEKLHDIVNFLLEHGQLRTLYVAPEKVWDGLMAKADGTDWNPGSGVGTYIYDEASTSWKFLG